MLHCHSLRSASRRQRFCSNKSTIRIPYITRTQQVLYIDSFRSQPTMKYEKQLLHLAFLKRHKVTGYSEQDCQSQVLLTTFGSSKLLSSDRTPQAYRKEDQSSFLFSPPTIPSFPRHDCSCSGGFEFKRQVVWSVTTTWSCMILRLTWSIQRFSRYQSRAGTSPPATNLRWPSTEVRRDKQVAGIKENNNPFRFLWDIHEPMRRCMTWGGTYSVFILHWATVPPLRRITCTTYAGCLMRYHLRNQSYFDWWSVHQSKVAYKGNQILKHLFSTKTMVILAILTKKLSLLLYHLLSLVKNAIAPVLSRPKYVYM